MKEISILGIDSAKNTFQLHAEDRRGGKILREKNCLELLRASIGRMIFSSPWRPVRGLIKNVHLREM